MAKVFYFLVTFLESGLAVFGIRSTFESPPYRIVAELGQGVEIRAYGARVAAETQAGANDGDAFSRLFRYITGANMPARMIAMTTPVEMRGMMGTAVPQGGTMRFFLPEGMAADPPAPTDPLVTIVRLPARTAAVLRFSGRLDRANVARHEAILTAAVETAGRKTQGGIYVMGYDPPFTLPFLRRNEVAVDVEP